MSACLYRISHIVRECSEVKRDVEFDCAYVEVTVCPTFVCRPDANRWIRRRSIHRVYGVTAPLKAGQVVELEVADTY